MLCSQANVCPLSLGIAKNEVMNIRFVLQDGQAHEVDSSDIAFRLAAAGAFETFYHDAGAIVLEPLMQVEATGKRKCRLHEISLRDYVLTSAKRTYSFAKF